MTVEIGKTMAVSSTQLKHLGSSLLAICSRRIIGCGLLRAWKILKKVPNTITPFFDAPEVAVCEEVAAAMTAVVQGVSTSCSAP